MTAVVAPPLHPLSSSKLSDDEASPVAIPSSDTAEARKRRREILCSQRLLVVLPPETTVSMMMSRATAAEDSFANKKRKVVSDESSVGSSSSVSSSEQETTSRKQKRPQFKYDPDVPMSKEEAVVWRREQRRQRNRESAAASRQRQRDRIDLLEKEVDEWKAKYETIVSRIQKLEAESGETMISEIDCSTRAATPTPVLEPQSVVTPLSSPIFSQSSAGTAQLELANPVSIGALDQELEELLPSKMTSRQA